MKRVFYAAAIATLAIAIIAVGGSAIAAYVTKIHGEPNGDGWTAESGGTFLVKSGGALTLNSGSTTTFSGTEAGDLGVTNVTATATVQGADVTSTDDLSVGDDASIVGITKWTVNTIAADDTTPSVAGGTLFVIPATWTAVHDITSFDNGVAGQVIIVVGGDTDCNITQDGNIHLSSLETPLNMGGNTCVMFTTATGTDWKTVL